MYLNRLDFLHVHKHPVCTQNGRDVIAEAAGVGGRVITAIADEQSFRRSPYRRFYLVQRSRRERLGGAQSPYCGSLAWP